MKITEFATSPEGNLVDPAQEWLVSTPVELTPSARTYRREFFLRFDPPWQAASSLIIDASTLNGVFRSVTYDVLDMGSPSPREALESCDGLVFLTLDAPRQIASVEFGSDMAVGPGHTMELYRVDGDTPSDKPTLSVPVSGGVANVPANDDFTAARFAVGLKPTGAPVTLNTGHLESVVVRSFPTTPKIGLGDAENADAATFFYIAPGQLDTNGVSGNVNESEALADALNRYVADLTSPYPEQLVIPLVFESDAPCAFVFDDVDGLSITFHESIEGFASGADKQVLRFAGGREHSLEVSLILPGNANVLAATVVVLESFGQHRPTTVDSPPMNDAILPKTGVHVGVENWNGWLIDRTEAGAALSVSGVALGLSTLTKDSQVLVEIQEDWQGRPSGRRLAGGELHLEHAGHSEWVTLMLPEPVVLASRPYWLLIKCSRGAVVWLAEQGEGAIHRFEQSTDTSKWSRKTAAKGLDVLMEFYSKTRESADLPPVRVLVGDVAVNVSQATGELSDPTATTRYDVSAALNLYLQNNPQAEPVEVPITFTSFLTGFATVYPPVVTYEIAVQT